MSVLISVAAGTLVTVTGTFNSETGTPTDPDTITLKYAQGQSGYPITTWVYEGAGSITRTGTGVYVAEARYDGTAGNMGRGMDRYGCMSGRAVVHFHSRRTSGLITALASWLAPVAG